MSCNNYLKYEVSTVEAGTVRHTAWVNTVQVLEGREFWGGSEVQLATRLQLGCERTMGMVIGWIDVASLKVGKIMKPSHQNESIYIKTYTCDNLNITQRKVKGTYVNQVNVK